MKPSASSIIQSKRIELDNGHLLQVGALIYRFVSDELQVMLITSRTTRRWIIPKGWPMPGKTLAEAALQEAYEEAGVHGIIEPQPIGYYVYEKTDMPENKNGPFDVDVFAVAFSHQEKKWPECKKRIFEWVIPAEAAARVNEPELKQIFLEFSRPSCLL